MKIVDMFDDLTEGGDLAGAGRDVSTPRLTGDELERQLKSGPNAFVQIIFRAMSEIVIGKSRLQISPGGLNRDDDSIDPARPDVDL